MPIFAYECEKCQETFEVLERAGAEGSHACPRCGGKQTRRLVSRFAAHVSAGQGACASGECFTSGCCPGGSCTL